MKHFLIGDTDRTSIQFIRYGLVGGIAFLADFSTLFVFTHFFGLYYLISAAIAFLVGLMVNYLISTRWVFHRRHISSRTVDFGLFGLIGIIGLGMNEAIMWILTEKLLLYYMVSKIVSTLLVYLWNFFARKYLLYR